MAPRRKSPFERVYRRLRATPDGCRIWTGAVSGYTSVVTVYVDGKKTTKTAAKVAWEHHHGPVPRGFDVLHNCPHPLCAEVTHLFLGQDEDRLRIQRQRKRFSCGRAHSIATSGEHSGKHKLTWPAVRGIRFAVKKAGWSHRRAACTWGVTVRTVQSVVSGHTWRPEYDPKNINWQAEA